MFSNPLLLSRRRCSHRIRLRLLPRCRCRLLCLLAGFRCHRLHPRLLQGCCLRLRLSDHLRLLPGFRPLPWCRCRRLHQRLLPGCCLRFRLHDHLRLFPGFCLRRLHPLPGCRAAAAFASTTTCACFRASASAASTRCRAAELPPPLPPSSVWLPFLPCNCLCILQARQRTNVRPLCPGSEKQTRAICRAKSKPFRFSNNGQQCSCKEVTVIVGGTLLPWITHEQT